MSDILMIEDDFDLAKEISYLLNKWVLVQFLSKVSNINACNFHNYLRKYIRMVLDLNKLKKKI